jgi:hypothetical protein
MDIVCPFYIVYKKVHKHLVVPMHDTFAAAAAARAQQGKNQRSSCHGSAW